MPKLFKKYCKDCGKLFRPKGRATKLCDNCFQKRMDLRKEKIKIGNKLRWQKKKINH